MTDAEKLEGIANFLEVQGSPVLALFLRQIAARSRKINEVVQRIDDMMEPYLDNTITIPCPECGSNVPLLHYIGCSVCEAFA